MSSATIVLILFCVALAVSSVSFPFVLRFAKRHQIVDNPNVRKLQRVPVPVMGGTAVFLGIAVSIALAITVFQFHYLKSGIICMTVMWLVGTWDDKADVPAMVRFVIETLLVWGLITFSEIGIMDFHGLWGLNEISLYYSVPLSVVAGVGIINAINLMDGVDGYCSGFAIIASLLYSILLFRAGNMAMGSFALICVGALMPFVLHNVFGATSKMFIGDGGSLMIGTALTVFIFRILATDSLCSTFAEDGLGLIPFTLSVLAIPVFDTLRVMIVRIARGNSPFHPDKTHLHHLFIEMGFSHIGTSCSIILINTGIVAVWWLSYLLGASIDWQFYIVVFLGMAATFGFYRFMKVQQAYNDGVGTPLYLWFCKLGAHTHIERKGLWRCLQHVADDILDVKE